MCNPFGEWLFSACFSFKGVIVVYYFLRSYFHVSLIIWMVIISIIQEIDLVGTDSIMKSCDGMGLNYPVYFFFWCLWFILSSANFKLHFITSSYFALSSSFPSHYASFSNASSSNASRHLDVAVSNFKASSSGTRDSKPFSASCLVFLPHIPLLLPFLPYLPSLLLHLPF